MWNRLYCVCYYTRLDTGRKPHLNQMFSKENSTVKSITIKKHALWIHSTARNNKQIYSKEISTTKRVTVNNQYWKYTLRWRNHYCKYKYSTVSIIFFLFASLPSSSQEDRYFSFDCVYSDKEGTSRALPSLISLAQMLVVIGEC